MSEESRFTDNVVSGSARNVVQAGAINGDVHFRHLPEADFWISARQLPPDIRGFTGRKRYLVELDGLLDRQGTPGRALTVCTIVGAPGVGKTALAVHWAHRVQERFPDGQLYLDLRGFSAAAPLTLEEASERVLRSLHVPARGIPRSTDERTALLRSVMSGRRYLVLLDNVADSAQVRGLLPGTSTCFVLVTSRVRLSGLATHEGAHVVKVGLLGEHESIELLRAMIGAERSAADPGALARMSRICAGLPLALRLAGERAAVDPHTGLEALAEDLETRRLALDDTLDERGAGDDGTVRGVLSWSYNAVSVECATLFRYLGLHPGTSFTRSSAAALTGVPPATAGRLLDGLARAHLVDKVGAESYAMHELLRGYAVELGRAADRDQARAAASRSIFEWYLHTASAARRRLVPHYREIPLEQSRSTLAPMEFRSYADAFAWCVSEQGNLAAAVHAAHEQGHDDIAWRIPAVLQRFYYIHKPWEDWLSTARTGLASARRCGDELGEAEILNSLGIAHIDLRRLTDALACHQQALAIRSRAGDRYGEGVSINNIGYVRMLRRETDQARRLFHQSIAIMREVGSPLREAMVLMNLGSLDFQLNEPTWAVSNHSEALRIFRELDAPPFEGEALRRLGRTYQSMGRIAEAIECHRDAVVIYSSLRDHGRQALCLIRLGDAERADGQPDMALASYGAALEIYRGFHEPHQAALAYEGAGMAYHDLGHNAEAIQCHLAALRIRRQLDDRWQTVSVLDNVAQVFMESGESEKAATALREAVGLLQGLSDHRSPEVLHRLRSLKRKLGEEPGSDPLGTIPR
jgi:tetratricopeptide (TPR) repeat protein